MKPVKFTNPITGETLIHREREGRRELLFDIYGRDGGRHSHAVWNNDRLSYLRDVNSASSVNDRFTSGS